MGEWPKKLVCEVTTFQEGPGILAKDFREVGIPLVRLAGLGGYEVTLDGCNYVSEEMGSGKWGHFRLTNGDILISTSASFGRPAIVGAEADGAIFYTGIIRFRSRSPLLDEAYLKLFLGSRRFSLQASAVASGSVIQHYGPSHLKKMWIDLPPVEVQRSIASTISALDDKIELNRRMNETLEASARALFRDWFVDFGPTRAKAQGRPAYLADHIWALFPKNLADDGIPKGWQWGTLADIAKNANVKIEPNSIAPDTPYIGLEHMPRQSIALTAWEGAGKVSSAKSAFKTGQILFGKLRPYFHKVGVAPVDGICSTDIVVLEATQAHNAALVLACVSTEDFVAFTDQGSTGTKMPRTSWSMMARYPLVRPDPKLAEGYQRLVGPMVDQIIANIMESRTLAETRDMLLPKLMSGEIRVAPSIGNPE